MQRKLITLSTALATRHFPGKVSVNGKVTTASIFDIEAVTVGHWRELVGKAVIGGKAYSVRASGFGEVWRVIEGENSYVEKAKMLASRS